MVILRIQIGWENRLDTLAERLPGPVPSHVVGRQSRRTVQVERTIGMVGRLDRALEVYDAVKLPFPT